MLSKIIHKFIIKMFRLKLSKIFYNIWSLYLMLILRYIVILLMFFTSFLGVLPVKECLKAIYNIWLTIWLVILTPIVVRVLNYSL
jgi:hypothetical protein